MPNMPNNTQQETQKGQQETPASPMHDYTVLRGPGEEGRLKTFNEFAASHPVEEVVAAYAKLGWDEAGDTYCSLAKAQVLQVPQTRIKTIGVYHYTMGVGGVERVTAWLANLWVSMGYAVVLFTDKGMGECAFELPEGIVRVEIPESFSVRKDTYAKRAQAIAQAIREYQIDAFVYQQWWNPLLIWDMMLIKLLKVPFLLFNHAPFKVFFSEAHPWEFEQSRVLRYTDGLVVLSAHDKRFWQRWTPRVWQTFNPVTIEPDLARCSALTSQEILWVGRLSGFDKQPGEALEIFARVREQLPGVHLTLVGDASNKTEYAKLQVQVKRLGIEDAVTFAGSKKDVRPFYENASVLLVTSPSESWCLVLAEAMACGLPSVMYEIPKLALVQNNESIAAVPQGNRAAAAQAIVELLNNSELRQARGQAGYEYISQVANFDFKAFWSAIFEQLEKGSPVREGYDAIDEDWDTVIAGMQESLAKATTLPVLSYVKRKSLKTIRKLRERS